MISRLRHFPSALLLSFLLLAMSSCFTSQPLEFKSIETMNMTNENGKPVLLFHLVMHNPNNWGVRINKMQTDFLVDGHTLGRGQNLNKIRMAHHADFKIPIRIETSNEALSELLNSGLAMLFGSTKSLQAEVRGTITFGKFILRKSYPFNYKQKLEGSSLRSFQN